MTKNRGVWVALAVLVAASLLMFFVVIPALRDGKLPTDLAGKVEDVTKQATDAAKQATDAAKKAADEAAQAAKAAADKAAEAAKQASDTASKVAGDVAGAAKTVVGEKMGRLKADASAATDELKTLLTSATPDAAAVTAARAKLESALQAVAAFKAPEGLDAVLGGLTAKTSEVATAALAKLSSLPQDPAQAGAVLDGLKADLMSAFDAVDKALKGDAAATDTKAATDQAATDTKAATDQAAAALSVLPSFDVLRVEKDGSTVIAGKASPEAKVEIVDGQSAIASTTATDTGDFVAVLDNPLPAGDHTIVLKVTGKDGSELVSEEVATVSVPKDASGELLAMVTKPGEASRIITAPTGTTDVAQNNATADTTKTEETKTTDVAQADPAKSVAVEPAKTGDVTIAIPDLPAASKDLANSAPVIGTETKPADTAATTAADTAAKTADTANAQPEVQVSAVEIEGDHLFVAGVTKPGAAVRIYADDKLVGEGKANEAGRFVIDNVMPLAVGSHTIRADVLSADGSKVEFRASVPFDRPAGEQLAVVADQNANAGTDANLVPLDIAKLDKAKNDAAKALALLNGLFANGKTPTAEELAAARSASEIALKALADFGATGDAAAVATAEAATKALDALKALPTDAASVSAGLGAINTGLSAILPAEVAMVTDAAKATETKAATDTQATDTQAQADTSQSQGTSTNDAAKPADAAKVDSTKAAEPAADATKATDTQDAATADKAATDKAATDAAATDAKASDTVATDTKAADADQPKVIEQAPLKESKSSVIIRKGDTLWQISRRVYGKGVRYTTIYVANKDQIVNPDEIMPGQIFGVPDTYLPNSEELHRELLEKHLGLHKRHK